MATRKYLNDALRRLPSLTGYDREPMSEPRRNDAATRPPRRDVPGTYPGPPGGAMPARAGTPRRRPPVRRAPPRWGALPYRRGLTLIAGGTVLGLLVTLAAGSGPGAVLGIFVIIGTAAAALAVDPRSVYRILPAPALAYLAAAVIAGLIDDRAVDTSRTGLLISAAQWAAGGFLAMMAATVAAIGIGAIRWDRSRQDRGWRGKRP